MSELTLAEDTGRVPERGVSAIEIRRGVLKRFLPASAASMGGFAMAMAVGSEGLSLLQVLLLGLEVGALSLGFGLGLTTLKRFLYSDAAVDRRKSLVAGLCAPLYLMLVAVFAEGASLAGIVGWSMLTGAGVAFTLFFPWLSRTQSIEDENIAPAEDSDLEVHGGPTV
jgi:hypothetical protein